MQNLSNIDVFTISGDLTPQCYFFFISRNRGGNGKF